MSFFIKRLAIIGVGLIGGSLAQSLKSQDLVGEVVGLNRRQSSAETALAMGVIDRSCATLEEAVHGASVVVVATPVSTIVPMVRAMAPHLDRGCVVTDVGSVKGTIVAGCEAVMPEGTAFVGGHPIAGREHAGVEHSFPTLFEGSRTILTPTSRTPPQALELVRLMWETTGTWVEEMDALFHDRVLAATSHMPHLMAYNVVNTLSDLEDHLQAEVFRYAAGGFRDFTRIASSDPTMWRDITLENREAILEILERFKIDLENLMVCIRERDAGAIFSLFSRSKNTRDRVIAEHRALLGLAVPEKKK